MNNIIRFPESKDKKTIDNPTFNEIPIEGSWSFTCPSCDNVSNFKAENMIFESVNFSCSGCKTLYKVVNPSQIKKQKDTINFNKN